MEDNPRIITFDKLPNNLEELKELTSYDNYMSASEAKKLGIIDKITAKMV